MTGVRRTSSSDTVNLIVEAYHNISEGEVARVDFAISSNGGTSSTTSVSSRQDWQPDDTDLKDPLPGNFIGPAPIPGCFGLQLAMSSYDAGYIDITATVVPASGTSRNVGTIRVYNDKDGTDRRPSTKVIYVSSSGSNSNSGLSTSTPVLTISKAFELCRASSSSSDVGGAQIYLMEGFHYWAGYAGVAGGATNWYTSGSHWITISPAPGVARASATIRRADDPGLWLTANGTTTGQVARIRLKNLKFHGRNCPLSCSTNITGHIWADGCEFAATEPNDTGDPSVHIYGNSGGPGGILNFNAAGTAHSRYATGCYIHHYMGPLSGFRMARGCKIEKHIGVCMQILGDNEGFCNMLITDMSQNNVKGLVKDSTSLNANLFIAGSIDLVNTGNGRVLLTARSSSTPDFGKSCSYLANSNLLGLKLSGWSNSLNNGTFRVASAGYLNGLSYVEIINTNNPPNQAGSTTGRIETACLGTPGFGTLGDPWSTLVHSDLHQVQTLNPLNWMMTNIRAVNSIQGQGISCNSGLNPGQFAIVNYFDGTPLSTANNNYLSGTWQHGIIRNCTFKSGFSPPTLSQVNLNCEIIDCVLDNQSTTAFPTVMQRGYNHYVQGQAPAVTGNTGGPFFSVLDPGKKGICYPRPGSNGYGTGSALWSRGSPGFYENHKGCYRNVTKGDWTQSQTSFDNGTIRTVNKATVTRSDIITAGMPFDRGILWSESQILVADGAVSAPQKVQWSALPARYDDGSIKYARLSYRVDCSAGSGQGSSLDSNIRIGGSYTSVPFTVSSAVSNALTLNGAVVLFTFNGINLTIPTASGTLIEGGGPEDHYARYRWFGRVPGATNIWVEFVWDVLSGLNHVKFWLRFGNSQMQRGWGLSSSPLATTAQQILSSPITLQIINCTPFLTFEKKTPTDTSGPCEVAAVTSVTNGKRYTIVDSGQSTHNRFPEGISKCVKGVMIFGSANNTATAEQVWPTLSIATNWHGRVPLNWSTNPRPSYITSDQVGIDYIENGHIPSYNSTFRVGQPYQRGVVGNPSGGGTGTHGWNNANFWSNIMYQTFQSKWPGELPYLEQSTRSSLSFRRATHLEFDGSYALLENYPGMGVWDGNIEYRSLLTQDNGGYGLGIASLQMPYDLSSGGVEWTGPDNQHMHLETELLIPLITCDYQLLALADDWSNWLCHVINSNHSSFSISVAINNPDRNYARTLMTVLAAYEVTKNESLFYHIKQRMDSLYREIYEASQTSSNWGLWGAPLSGLDKFKWLALHNSNQAGDLALGRDGTYQWQSAFLSAAFYKLYKLLYSQDRTSSYTTKAKRLAFDYAASNVLYTIYKVGPGSENNWQYFTINATPAQDGSWVPGSTVTSASGASGVIMRTLLAELTSNKLDLMVRSCSGSFLSGETITNGTSAAATTIHQVLPGYLGCIVYYRDMTKPLASRQDPLTLSELEAVTTNGGAWNNERISPARNYRPNIAYFKWQLPAVAVAKQGIREGYYSDDVVKTVAYLSTKVEDIIADNFSDFDTSPTRYYNSSPLWDLDFWPYLMFVDNAGSNTATVVNYTKNSETLNGLVSIRPFTVTANIVANVTISPSVYSATSSISSINVFGTAVANFTFSPTIPISGTPTIRTFTITAQQVSNTTNNVSDALSGTPSIQAPTIYTEQNQNFPVLIHVTLYMLIDTPAALLIPINTYQEVNPNEFERVANLDSGLTSDFDPTATVDSDE